MIPKWKAGEIIRQKNNGKPYLVIHVHKNIATLIFDIESKDSDSVRALLERDYEHFATEDDMKMVVKKNDNLDLETKFEFDPVNI